MNVHNINNHLASVLAQKGKSGIKSAEALTLKKKSLHPALTRVKSMQPVLTCN